MKKTYGLLSLLALVAIGCGKPGQDTKEIKEIVTSNVIAKDESQWPISQVKYDDQSQVRVIKYQMTKEQLESERNLYHETDMQPFPISPLFNTQLFQILNIEAYKKILFVPPKLWVYQRVDGGRTAPYENADGTVSIQFPMVLVTGLEEKVQDPSGKEILTLPESLKVKNLDKMPLGDSSLAALPGCPKKVIINFNGNDYDATPNEFLRGDYCDLSHPFSAVVKLSKKEAEYFLQKAIYQNAAHASVVYETKARFNKARVEIEFNRSKVWTELQAKLKAKLYWAELDVRTHLRDILSKQTMNVNIVGDVSGNMDLLITYAIAQFMMPFEKTDSSDVTDCDNGTKVACFKLSYDKFKESNEFKVSWYQSDTAMTGQNYVTFAPLQPLTDRKVSIGEEGKEPLYSGKDGVNNSREIMTVVSGDLIELTPTQISKESMTLKEPKKETLSSDVCLEKKEAEKVCVKWTYEPGGCHAQCNGVSLKNTRVKICVQYEDRPAQCLRSENQWVEMTTYSSEIARTEIINNPVAQFENLFTGMELGFRWVDKTTGSKKELNCSIDLFDYTADDKTASIRVLDQPTCPVFANAKGASVMMFLVNNISKPMKYLEGKLKVNFKNEVMEQPELKTFVPAVGFYGTVAIKGAFIEGMSNPIRNN
ncbi:MAG: hypothetical protein ACOYL6_02225 [Bacteriovoracaceae bacterium]